MAKHRISLSPKDKVRETSFPNYNICFGLIFKINYCCNTKLLVYRIIDLNENEFS